jgi:flagellin-like protein
MKSITPVISVILLILMTIITTSSSYFFINSNVLELESKSNLESYPGMDNSRLSIISITGAKVIVRNDGTNEINDLIVFINKELLNYELNGTILPSNLFEINYNPRQIGEDLEIKIIYNKGKIVTNISPARLNTNASGFTDTLIPLN